MQPTPEQPGHTSRKAAVSAANSATTTGQLTAEQPAAPQKLTIFCPTVVRFSEAGKVWMMNRQDGGWNRRGYRYDSLPALLEAWDVEAGEFGRDEHSYFLRVSPAKEGK